MGRTETWCLRIGCRGDYQGPKTDEITVECRKLHTGEFRNLYFFKNMQNFQLKENEIDTACDAWESRGMHTAFRWEQRKGKATRKTSLYWEDDIKIYFREI